MGGNGSIGCFSHPRDEAGFHDAAGMTEVRLQDGGCALFQDFPEPPFGEDSFAGGDGKKSSAGDISHELDVLALDWFFDEHGAIRFQSLDEKTGIGRTDGAVKIDSDIDTLSTRFAQG